MANCDNDTVLDVNNEHIIWFSDEDFFESRYEIFFELCLKVGEVIKLIMSS